MTVVLISGTDTNNGFIDVNHVRMYSGIFPSKAYVKIYEFYFTEGLEKHKEVLRTGCRNPHHTLISLFFCFVVLFFAQFYSFTLRFTE